VTERELARRAAAQAGVDPHPRATRPTPEVTVVGPRIGDRQGARRRVRRARLTGPGRVSLAPELLKKGAALFDVRRSDTLQTIATPSTWPSSEGSVQAGRRRAEHQNASPA